MTTLRECKEQLETLSSNDPRRVKVLAEMERIKAWMQKMGYGGGKKSFKEGIKGGKQHCPNCGRPTYILPKTTRCSACGKPYSM